MEYLFAEELRHLKIMRQSFDTAEIERNIKKCVFSINDTGISSRVLFNWEKNNLLIGEYDSKRWKKFNLIEYTWLKIIQELRKYKVSLKIIEEVKLSLLDNNTIEDLPNQELLTEALIEIAPQDKKDQVKKLLKQDDFRQQMEAYSFTLLELIILYVILLKGNYSLLVNSDGICIPFKLSFFEKYLEYESFKDFISGSFISISITEILSDFMIKNEDSIPQKKLSLLSESESQLISIIRKEKVVSVKVKKNNENEIELIEEFRHENIDKSARLMDIILSQGYQTIEIKTQKGEIVNCTNIIKTKI